MSPASHTPRTHSVCPGCGLELPPIGRAYDRKFHASAECWALYEDVLAREYQDPALFARVHRLTVDAWTAQHAGGRHPDKSVAIHLVGLCLVLERGFPHAVVARHMGRLAARASWPRMTPPAARAALTVLDVRRAGTPGAHARVVRDWAAQVWAIWSSCHAELRALADALT